ncbi:MAG: hypothetical protein IJ532_00900 [Alphaproteobacteria bacterium]|nr:hypothetical protein [Alphaproteobacteria bacterium]
MGFVAPDHYSYKFKFDIEKLPAIYTDKISAKISICGIFSGLLFVALGLFELVYYFMDLSDESYDFSMPSQMTEKEVFWFRYSFDSFILLFGLLIVFLSVAALLRRKTIFFDGDNIRITHKPLFGEEKVETESLYKYLGVLLKVEYYQFGLINRNRYIIELYHKEKNKRVPLYISTSGENIREIWEYYSEKLKMPALFMTDHGLVSRNHNELDKTLKVMSKRWQLDAVYDEEKNAPASLKYKVKSDRVILKEKRLFFDAYTILSLLGILILGSLMMYAGVNYQVVLQYIGFGWFVCALGVGMLVIIFSLISIFCKDVLIINKHDLILGHNLTFLRMDIEFMPKDEIESIDIGHNPLTDRYYLSVISHNKSMIFGKNMPIEDLRWIRGCLIREIVK